MEEMTQKREPVGRRNATTCRYCGEGGRLDHGAHLRCKYLATRFLKRTEGPCARCQVKPRLLTSKYQLCEECSAENKKASIKAANKRWYLKKKDDKLGPPPICKCGCGQPVEDRRRRLYATKECMEKVSNASHVEKQRVRRAAAPKAPPPVKTVVVRERPHAEPAKPIAPPPPEVIIVPAHVKVQRVEPFGSAVRGLRNIFGDEQGRTWSAVD